LRKGGGGNKRTSGETLPLGKELLKTKEGTSLIRMADAILFNCKNKKHKRSTEQSYEEKKKKHIVLD